jgi:hypothetical protein
MKDEGVAQGPDKSETGLTASVMNELYLWRVMGLRPPKKSQR